MAFTKEELDQQYQEKYGRASTGDEYAGWAKWVQDNNASTDMFRNSFAGAVASDVGSGAAGSDLYKNEIIGKYGDVYGRAPTADELKGWQSWLIGRNGNLDEFNKNFDTTAKADMTKSGTLDPLTGKMKAPTTDWESYIKQSYDAKMPGIEAGIRGTAAGGGLDTGGYMTSLAKAKTASWSDMLSNLMGYKQQQEQFDYQKTLPYIQRGWQTQDQDKQYQLLNAQMAAQTPGGWDYITAGAGTGATIGGTAAGPVGAGWGALIGGLAGWGKSQGFFK